MRVDCDFFTCKLWQSCSQEWILLFLVKYCIRIGNKCILTKELLNWLKIKCQVALLQLAKKVLMSQAPMRHSQPASRPNRPEGLEGMVLWIDSTDFCTQGEGAMVPQTALFWEALGYCDQCQRPSPVGVFSFPSFCVWWRYITISCASELDCLFPGLEMVGDNHFRKAAHPSWRVWLFILISPKQGGQRWPKGRRFLWS